MKKALIIGAVILVLFIVGCGLGGYSLLRSFQDGAKSLEPEFARSKKNGIPLSLNELTPERAIAPNENAALLYKKAFDEWVIVRPEVSDERWQSYLGGNVGADEQAEINNAFDPAVMLMAEASRMKSVQWSISYEDHAFSSNSLFGPLTEVHQVWVRSGSLQGPPEEMWVESLKERLAPADHVLESRDPSSLRAAAVMRLETLNKLAAMLPNFFVNAKGNPGSWGSLFAKNLEVLEQVKPIDPLPVWRTTAFLQFNTWDSYEKLTKDQKALFGGARRDDGVMLDAASTEILKFWNTAIESAKDKPELVQYTTLGEMVLRMRERTDLAAVPLKQLWSLDSATQGAGSLEWILANEQLMMMKQVLDVLSTVKGAFPETFDCKRISVIGMKTYTYERTANGFKISVKPSDVLAPESMLAKQSLAYEFVEIK